MLCPMISRMEQLCNNFWSANKIYISDIWLTGIPYYYRGIIIRVPRVRLLILVFFKREYIRILNKSLCPCDDDDDDVRSCSWCDPLSNHGRPRCTLFFFFFHPYRQRTSVYDNNQDLSPSVYLFNPRTKELSLPQGKWVLPPGRTINNNNNM